jgi:hypothetical protein
MPKQKSLKANISRPDDTPAMKVAVKTLRANNVDFFRPSANQLKVEGKFNFYPNTGSINYDQQSRLPESGLEALLTLVRKVKRRPGGGQLSMD